MMDRDDAAQTIEFAPFEPHPWFGNTHAMTIAASFAPRSHARLTRAAESRYFAVGADTKVLALCNWQSGDAPLVVLVHGLTGSAETAYMRGTATKAFRAGFHVVRLNTRNCGNTEHLTPTLYQAGLTEDIAAVTHRLAEDGHGRIYLVGFSLGGNQILKLLGELGAATPSYLRGAAGVSVPIDLTACAAAMNQPGLAFSLYRRYFLKKLARRMRTKARHFPGRFDLEGLRRLRTIEEFDDRYTAPNFGYADAKEYYLDASTVDLVPKLRVPLLLIQARDDPLVPFDAYERLPTNGTLRLLTPEHGGHLGFLGRAGRRPRILAEENYWAEEQIVRWFASLASDRTGDQGGR